MTISSQYIPLADPSCMGKPRHLAYYEFGDRANADAVICVHGLSRNGLDFEILARELSRTHRVICPDMAGRGNSDWLTNKLDYNYTLYTADILALLAWLKLPQVSWVGTSMGGILGMMLAAANPLLIKNLVLNDVGSVVSAAGLKRIMGYVGTSATFPDRPAAEVYMKSVLAPFGITTEDQWKHAFQSTFFTLPDGRYMLRYDPDISQPLKAAASVSDAVTDIDLTAFWLGVKCPTLILRGETSDILTRQTAESMRAGRAGVKLSEIPGAGHAPALLDRGQVALITDWLDNTPQC